MKWPACRQAGIHAIMWYVYVLKSLSKNDFYKGLTDNLDRRLRQHFSAQVVSTRLKLPLELIHVEICESRVEARRVEKFFKSGFGREVIKELTGTL
ncbi:MAG: GIY-YIG nuclease family protein [Candidatus Curtissbacteria bacterium]